MEQRAGIEINVIEPYSPEWWKLRLGCFTGSEIWKLMTAPKGKSPMQKWEDCKVLLNGLAAKYNEILIEKRQQKSSLNLMARIEKNEALVKELFEKRNDFHFSDTAETYILEKVHEKLTGKPKNNVDNFATQWGIEHEPMAKKWYSKITGNVVDLPYMMFHESIEGYSCTPDGLINEDGLSEFKCPANGANHLKHWLISNDEYFLDKHDDYFYQCQSQMQIFQRPKMDFVSFDPRIDNDKGMFIYSMNYDAAIGEQMEQKITVARELFNQYYQLFSK